MLRHHSNGTQQYYFVSIMKNRLDNKAKRGAVVKALAVGSRRAHIPECFKSVASTLLDRIFDVAAGDDAKNYENNVRGLM